MEENKEVLKKRSAMPVSSFVCGILSIIFVAFYYISLPTGIIAIIFGAKGAKRTGSKLAKTGMILGIIGLSLFIFTYMMFISVILLEY